MTQNQIAYWNLQENQRHNQQSERIEDSKVDATRRGQDIQSATADKDRKLKDFLGTWAMKEQVNKRHQDMGLGIANSVSNFITGLANAASKVGAGALRLFK